MTAVVGSASLLAAFALARWGSAAPLLGARTRRADFFATARVAIAGQLALVTVASLALIYALDKAEALSRVVDHLGRSPQPVAHAQAKGGAP